MAGWQDDPVVGGAPSGGGGWQSDPVVGGAKAAPAQKGAYQPTWLDKVTNVANPTLGLGDLLASGVGQGIAALGGQNLIPSVAQARAQRSQEASELGPVTSTAARIAGYGPMGAVLGPEGATAGLVGRPIAQGMAEGALAGGISDFDPNDPASALRGAAGGAALGGAAGGISKGIGKLTGPGAPTIDPAAAVAQTKAARDQAYAPLKTIAFNPNDILGAHTSATLTPGMAADVSPGVTSMLQRQQKAILNGGNTANDIADYVTNLRSAGGAPGASNGDRILMGQTADNLEGLLANGQPITGQAPGDAMRTLTQARQAHAQYENAQALQQLQQQLKDFGQGPGGVPQKQAETYYDPGDPEYQAWSSIAQAARPGLDPSYMAAHIGGDIGEAAGLATLGPVGMLGGKALGYLGAKKLAKKAVGGWQDSALLKAYQAQYPTLTGIRTPPTQTTASPMVGDLIKNLMIGGAY